MFRALCSLTHRPCIPSVSAPRVSTVPEYGMTFSGCSHSAVHYGLRRGGLPNVGISARCDVVLWSFSVELVRHLPAVARGHVRVDGFCSDLLFDLQGSFRLGVEPVLYHR